ncbi:MAG: sortase (surface protein transpeptidase) [Flavobacteriales bacterium]|jgi:sortase (surface protein transpeptidase)
MNKLLISTIITAGILLAGNAQASKIDTVTENNLIKVCEAIKSDSLIKVKVAVQESGINIRKIANGLVCNGFDPVSFALTHNAEKTAKYMANKSNVNHQELVAKL